MAAKKEVEIYRPYGTHLYELKFIGGGQLPDILKGRFTSFKLADIARQKYYSAKSQRPIPKDNKVISEE